MSEGAFVAMRVGAIPHPPSSCVRGRRQPRSERKSSSPRGDWVEACSSSIVSMGDGFCGHEGRGVRSRGLARAELRKGGPSSKGKRSGVLAVGMGLGNARQAVGPGRRLKAPKGLDVGSRLQKRVRDRAGQRASSRVRPSGQRWPMMFCVRCFCSR
jgi:hypothetical protein